MRQTPDSGVVLRLSSLRRTVMYASLLKPRTPCSRAFDASVCYRLF